MRPGKNGFTLLETMVALAILGLSIMAMLQLFSGAADSARRVRAQTEAMALAQSHMELLLTEAEADRANRGTLEGTFQGPFHRYRYEVVRIRLTDRNLMEIRLRVIWSDPGAGQIELSTRRTMAPDRLGL